MAIKIRKETNFSEEIRGTGLGEENSVRDSEREREREREKKKRNWDRLNQAEKVLKMESVGSNEERWCPCIAKAGRSRERLGRRN
jgi:hypothetical protein